VVTKIVGANALEAECGTHVRPSTRTTDQRGGAEARWAG
jgi:hypothetical protein